METNVMEIETTAEIDLMENAVYIVKDGMVTKIRARKQGNHTLYWQDGKVLDVVENNRTRVRGQDVI